MRPASTRALELVPSAKWLRIDGVEQSVAGIGISQIDNTKNAAWGDVAHPRSSSPLMMECVLHLEEDDERTSPSIFATYSRLSPIIGGEARDGDRYLTAQTIDGFRFWPQAEQRSSHCHVGCRR